MGLDLVILDALNPDSPVFGLDQFMMIVSLVGYTYFMVLAAIPIWYKGKRLEGFTLAVMVLILEIVTFALKNGIARPRPTDVHLVADVWFMPLAHYSFPSGHAVIAAAFAAFLASMLWRVERGRMLSLLVMVFAALVCVSRCYLGVHYPSDVLAGIIIGAPAGLLFFKLCRYKPYSSKFREVH